MPDAAVLRLTILRDRFPRFPANQFFCFTDVADAAQFCERVVPFRLKLDPNEKIIRPTRSGLVYTLDANLLGWLRDSRGVRILVRWDEPVGSMRSMNWPNIWIDLNGYGVNRPTTDRPLTILKPTVTKERRGLLMEQRIQAMLDDPDFRI